MQPVWGWRVFATRFGIALAIVSVATASSFGYAYWFANQQINRASHVHISDKDIPAVQPAQAANYLIVGSDSRSFVHDKVAQDHFGDTSTNPENLADVIMIAHVDPKSPGKGFLVSIPRDTWVDVPRHGHQKINATLNEGFGPSTLIETIHQNFHVTINHYLKLDFLAFTDVVNAIGHVDIFFPAPAYDAKTGLYVKTAGCAHLGGLQALAYARSRYYRYKTAADGSDPKQWTKDGRSDLGRIKRQQYFIRSLAQKAIKDGGRNPLTARRILEKIVVHLTVDQNMHLPQFLSLVRAFRSVNPGAVQMLTVPTDEAVQHPGGDVQIVRQAQAVPIFNLLGSFTKTTKPAKAVPRSRITVQVLNGSGVKGIAATTQQALLHAGFARGAAPTDADSHTYALTEVRYTAGHEGEARQVAAYLGVGLPAKSEAPLGAHVVVVTGADFTGVRAPGSHTVTTTATATSTPTPTTSFPNLGSTPGVTLPKSAGSEPVGCS